jgi:serine/threonine protein phosphatase PrpC
MSIYSQSSMVMEVLSTSVVNNNLGSEVARFSQKHFIDQLLSNNSFQKGDYPKALRETFLAIDELMKSKEGQHELDYLKVFDQMENGPSDKKQAGCTACVALIVERTIYCANAGDSRCVLFRSGKPIPLSKDHNLDSQKEVQRIKEAGGHIEGGRLEGRLNMTRGFGDLDLKENDDLDPKDQLMSAYPDISKTEIDGNAEFLIVGCDGIWDHRTNDEICSFIYKYLTNKENLGIVVENLLDKLLAQELHGYGNDNMTCICLSFV